MSSRVGVAVAVSVTVTVAVTVTVTVSVVTVAFSVQLFFASQHHLIKLRVQSYGDPLVL